MIKFKKNILLDSFIIFMLICIPLLENLKDEQYDEARERILSLNRGSFNYELEVEKETCHNAKNKKRFNYHYDIGIIDSKPIFCYAKDSNND